MDDLKLTCEEILHKSLGKSNVCKVLLLADKYNCADLKKTCLQSMVKWKGVMTDEELEPIKSHTELLLDFFRMPASAASTRALGEGNDDGDDDDDGDESYYYTGISDLD